MAREQSRAFLLICIISILQFKLTSLIATCRESLRRISHELMPPEFTYASLDEVIRYFVYKLIDAQSNNIEIIYKADNIGDRSWDSVPDEISIEIYRIVQEALGNSIKYSNSSLINVHLIIDNNNLEVLINDNGHFQSTGKKGVGLDSIRRRVDSIKGE